MDTVKAKQYHTWVMSGCIFLLSLGSFVLSHPSPAERVPSYDGFQVLRLRSEDRHALYKTILTMEQQAIVDVWARRRRSADVIVAPEHLRYVRETSSNQNIRYDVIVDDLHRYLHQDLAERHLRHKRSTPNVTSHYLTYQQMKDYVHQVSRTAQNADVTVTTIGQSAENNDVIVVEIREKTPSQRDKHAILIEAGIHAREWIAPAMALNIIHKLALHTDNDVEEKGMLQKFDWFIVPSANPDGYIYSQSSQGNRLWRKTRTSQYSSVCRGVDGNRNFGYKWDADIGGSTNPCAEVYAGPKGFSEPETRNLRDWILRHKERAVAYLSVHSYGELLLYPYGFSSQAWLADQNLMGELGSVFQSKLGETGHHYQVGNSARLLYAAAGGSDDYAKGAANITASYTVELSPSFSDPSGFILPESAIQTVVRDTWPGFKAMASKLFEVVGYPQGGMTPQDTTPSLTSTTAESGAGWVKIPGSGWVYFDAKTYQWLKNFCQLYANVVSWCAGAFTARPLS